MKRTWPVVVILTAALVLAACGAVPSASGTPAAGPVSTRASSPSPVATAEAGAKQPAIQATAPRATPARNAEASPTRVAAISVVAPANGDTVSSPVRIQGAGHAFEGQILLHVKDKDGRVIGSGQVVAGALGTPVPFSVDVPFQSPSSPEPGTVEVFSLSPKDGSVEDLVTVQVTLKPLGN